MSWSRFRDRIMTDSAVGMAFLMGVVSAVSLSLGALTATRYRFTDRVVSFLMAFGGGALLAALTLDLVAHGIDSGHVWTLGLGWVAGSVLFIVLNNAVNDIGGFARKVSTRLYQLRRQERRRFRKFLSGLRRLDIFADLPPKDYDALLASVQQQHYPKGSYLFRRGDPADFLYLIESGDVDLVNPRAPAKNAVKDAERLDVIGRLSFLTGAPSALHAVALTDCVVLKLPRSAFIALLPNSPALIQEVHRWLRGDKVYRYLVTLQRLPEAQVEAWVAASCSSLYRAGQFRDAVPVARQRDRFLNAVDRVRSSPLFSGLPRAEQEILASLLVHKRHPKGHTFFFVNEVADRMYFLDTGEVGLYDEAERVRAPEKLLPNRTFGVDSFLAGTRHSMSAVAVAETAVWVLRRSDLDALIRQAPVFAMRVQQLVADGDIERYLVRRHHLSAANAAIWSNRALKDLQARQSLPSASAFILELPSQHGAPMAIWLGIMLDGIPEALVIGASLVHSQLSVSLIAGLFIANYPEALSSSAGMREQGFSQRRIHLMWGSLVVLTGVFAAVGNVFFSGAPPVLFTFIQGMAAGAMLTMISQTMLPEAYLRGGSVVGIATPLGFLAAVLLKPFG
jgi:CRP-like cAMP-binding protein